MIRLVYTLVVAGLPFFSVIKVVGDGGVLGRPGILAGVRMKRPPTWVLWVIATAIAILVLAYAAAS